jgi:hypothetical protein
MTASGGGTFDLSQFDGAETFIIGSLFGYINLTGIQADATVLNLQFALDGLRDGAGGVPDFQTFAVGWTRTYRASPSAVL